jgi:hypothetical protein
MTMSMHVESIANSTYHLSHNMIDAQVGEVNAAPTMAEVQDMNAWQDSAGWPQQNARGYKILEQPLGTMRPMRVVFIGAGASGICFSKFAQDTLSNVDIQLYEKNDDVGGTWLENRWV